MDDNLIGFILLRRINLSKDNLKGSYFLLVLVILLELGWLYSVTKRPNPGADLTFVVTIIASTISMGIVGLWLFKETEDKK